MGTLGSVFDEGEAGAEGGADPGLRGPDLRVTVEIPRRGLGHGIRARVPLRMAADGDLVERVSDPEHPQRVLVHLPADLPEGAVLRLRGQGGVPPAPPDSGDSGVGPAPRAGDLYIVVQLVDREPEPGELVETPGGPREVDPESGEGRDVTGMVLMGMVLMAAAVLGLTWALT